MDQSTRNAWPKESMLMRGYTGKTTPNHFNRDLVWFISVWYPVLNKTEPLGYQTTKPAYQRNHHILNRFPAEPNSLNHGFCSLSETSQVSFFANG